jgi:hypothetical protein
VQLQLLFPAPDTIPDHDPNTDPASLLNLPKYEMHFCHRSRDSWATGWTIGVLGFDSRRGLRIFLFTTASRTALGPTQPPLQWVPGALSLGVKRPGSEADHSPPSSAEIKNERSYTSTPPTRFTAWCLVRDNFTFNFTFPFTFCPLHVSSEAKCELFRW